MVNHISFFWGVTINGSNISDGKTQFFSAKRRPKFGVGLTGAKCGSLLRATGGVVPDPEKCLVSPPEISWNQISDSIFQQHFELGTTLNKAWSLLHHISHYISSLWPMWGVMISFELVNEWTTQQSTKTGRGISLALNPVWDQFTWSLQNIAEHCRTGGEPLMSPSLRWYNVKTC